MSRSILATFPSPCFRVLLGLLWWAGTGLFSTTQAQERLTVNQTYDPSKLVPVSLSGLDGEAAQVVRFDLEVQGCVIVPEAEALYRVSGKLSARLEGYLATPAGKYLVAKAYTGGNVRSQAHAFSDDIILAITGQKGVAQTRIAFKNRSGGNGEIYLADYDGRNAQAVTRDNTIVAAPSWGPGQRSLFYTSYKLNNPDILAHDLVTGDRRIIARHPGSNLTPVPSPDGTRLAMVLSKTGSPNLFVSDLNGGGLRQLTHQTRTIATPTWSPDGRWICYTSQQDGPPRLYKVPAGGGNAVRISTQTFATEPDWSPDGKWIAFTIQSGGFWIAVVPANGGPVQTLVPGEDPSWAPNSRTLMFVRTRGDHSNFLSLLDVPTKHVKDVFLNLGNASQPAWAR